MRIEVCADAETVAHDAAAWIAAELRAAVQARDIAHLAVSGGETPWRMLARLVRTPLPWSRVHLWQVDERVAPRRDPARNWSRLEAAMRGAEPAGAVVVHPMPVEETPLEEGARRYGETLEKLAGAPPVLDVVHLGLGSDGHTASLFPGDPAVAESARPVALTAPHGGRRRMTLTLPVLSRARRVLWLVTGAEKAAALARLVRGDPALPASRVPRERARLLASRDAARALGTGRSANTPHVGPSF